MKKISGILSVIIILVSCSSTEPMLQEAEQEAVYKDASGEPSWYQSAIQSSVDSLAFYGYSMASSHDSANAYRLARETSVNNLRFEIDKLAEETRRTLANTTEVSGYETPAFIIQLRNSVSKIDLSDIDIDIETDQSGEGVYYVYARSMIPIEVATQRLAGHLDDVDFIDNLLK
jgi:hypothetical protein